MKNQTRRDFIIRSSLGATGLILLPGISTSQTLSKQNQDKGPPIEISLVKEFVGAAHKDMAKVKTMLEVNPDLLNSVNNLGGWDWEDALGAAGHVGNPELANFLLERGARMTICVAAMLGKTELVKSFILNFSFMKDAVGPHKISLMRHAKAGGEKSLEVIDYLKSLGLKE
ncbi:hypothetical protein [Aurantibacillus circumpalustris]|uniref:hypothetical protein n=1 Tax=Aurantibacillus circumpalustris TaxID=3036359 RepID=UPI00295BE6EF|nr:hypothetical protein [Aurantibacillus circumpalustris]